MRPLGGRTRTRPEQDNQRAKPSDCSGYTGLDSASGLSVGAGRPRQGIQHPSLLLASSYHAIHLDSFKRKNPSYSRNQHHRNRYLDQWHTSACNSDKRCRLFSWGISAVALSHDGTWECSGTRAGFVEGPKQAVPRAELRALVELTSSTQGEVHCSCDSLVTVKNLRRLMRRDVDA